MEKTSKIQSVEMLQEWTHQASGDTMYPHKVMFENGDIAIANKKKPNAYTVGQEIKYTLQGQDNQGNWKFKEVQQKQNWNRGGKQGGPASFALSYAKDLAVARINNGTTTSSQDVLKVASEFTKWLKENE